MTTRRDLLASLGTAAAGALAFNTFRGDTNAALRADEGNNPAANVADRTSTIKITRITPTPVKRKVFLKVETNHGVTGWGEIDQLEPYVATALVKSLFELLDGENPTRIEHLWQKIYRSHRDMRGGPFMTHTLAGIDMALWDITGKLWGVPVYRLLGGPTRDKVRMYPSESATKVGAGPQPFSGSPQQIEGFVKTVENARAKVGPKGLVMFDAHCALPPPFLMQLASALKPYDLLYIEEPAVPGNIEVFKRLKKHISIPLAVGEQARTIWEVIPYLQEGCADILQIDCAHTGGISQMRKIAILGEAYHVPLAPHCVTTDLGVTASLHVSASIPFFLIHEYYPSITPPGLVKKSWSLDKDGYASLPEGPGIGCEVDEAVLAELAKQPSPPEWPTRGRLSDGSIADY
ncbi:D-galactonate dehydratase [Anatilimnocola aggregata]|uniref:D-galactonate dehydratase n=1 Tax=Anatilimnocola aggregata TaxID=2528021 RepID=A0A517YJ46_9BACT|nr:mandelate racemase/muconate lactonizing enzyme family protein [Anatilimnocola aggregata]QDU30241.1 D-galactonate dehydratase [Anatilimnocola aggregata]